ncbi:MAG: hypothetical protein LDL41_11660 [Coleofasciculus sp. S288]|nr:hypothetical protein [Coleofasciculus sp. S288]
MADILKESTLLITIQLLLVEESEFLFVKFIEKLLPGNFFKRVLAAIALFFLQRDCGFSEPIQSLNVSYFRTNIALRITRLTDNLFSL